MRLEEDEFVLTYDEESVSLEQILDACKGAGFPASIAMEDLPNQVGTDVVRRPNPNLWPDFLRRAFEKSKAENKLFILDFSADWCAPCRQMERETFTDSLVQSLLRDAVFVKIDTDEQPQLTRTFGVTGIPDIRFLSPSGDEVLKSLGFTNAQEFAELIRKSIEVIQSPTMRPTLDEPREETENEE